MAGLFRLPIRSPLAPLDRVSLPDGHAQWIQSRVGKPAVTVADLEQLSLATDLPADKRESLETLRSSLQGEVRAQGRTVDVMGVNAAREGELTRKWVQPPTGEPPIFGQLREDMQPGLWGQEHATEGFVQLLKDYQSPARRTPPTLALSGDIAHGKDQANAALLNALFGPEGRVISADFTGARDRNFDAFFHPVDGILAGKKVAALAKDGSGLLHLHNTEDLATNAPALAAELSRRLLVQKGDPEAAFLPWVFDFDSAADPRTLMVSALGEVGNRTLSATAKLGHLDGPTMVRYAEKMLPELLAAEGLAGLKIELYPESRELLGEALATPHAPLDELEHRLLRLVLTHLDTQTQVDREHGILGVFPGIAAQSAEGRAALLAELHGLSPDLLAAKRLFGVREVAKHGLERNVSRDFAALQEGMTRFEESAQRLLAAPEAEPGLHAAVGELFGHGLGTVRTTAHNAERAIALDARLGILDEGLSPASRQLIGQSLGTLREGLVELARHALAAPGGSLPALSAASFEHARAQGDEVRFLAETEPLARALFALARAEPSLEAPLGELVDSLGLAPQLAAALKAGIGVDLDGAGGAGLSEPVTRETLAAEPAGPLGTSTATAEQAREILLPTQQDADGNLAHHSTEAYGFSDDTLRELDAAGVFPGLFNYQTFSLKPLEARLGILRVLSRVKELGLGEGMQVYDNYLGPYPVNDAAARVLLRAKTALGLAAANITLGEGKLATYEPEVPGQRRGVPLGDASFPDPVVWAKAFRDGDARTLAVDDRTAMNIALSVAPDTVLAQQSPEMLRGAMKLYTRARECGVHPPLTRQEINRLPGSRGMAADVRRFARAMGWEPESVKLGGRSLAVWLSTPDPGQRLGARAASPTAVAALLEAGDPKLFQLSDSALEAAAPVLQEGFRGLWRHSAAPEFHREVLKLWDRANELGILGTSELEDYTRDAFPLELGNDPAALLSLARLSVRNPEEPLAALHHRVPGEETIASFPAFEHPFFGKAELEVTAAHANEDAPPNLRRLPGPLGDRNPTGIQTAYLGYYHASDAPFLSDDCIRRELAGWPTNGAEVTTFHSHMSGSDASIRVLARVAELSGAGSKAAAAIRSQMGTLMGTANPEPKLEALVRLARAVNYPPEEIPQENGLLLGDDPRRLHELAGEELPGTLRDPLRRLTPAAVSADPVAAHAALKQIFSGKTTRGNVPNECAELIRAGLAGRASGSLTPLAVDGAEASALFSDIEHPATVATLAGLYTHVPRQTLQKLLERRGASPFSAARWADTAESLAGASGSFLEELFARPESPGAGFASTPLSVVRMRAAAAARRGSDGTGLTEAFAADLLRHPERTLTAVLDAASREPAGSAFRLAAMDWARDALRAGTVVPAELVDAVHPGMAGELALDRARLQSFSGAPEELASLLADNRHLPRAGVIRAALEGLAAQNPLHYDFDAGAPGGPFGALLQEYPPMDAALRVAHQSLDNIA